MIRSPKKTKKQLAAAVPVDNIDPHIRVLEVTPEDLATGNMDNFERLFGSANFDKAARMRALRGRCVLLFPVDDEPDQLFQIPLVRDFVERLHDCLPYFPYFFAPQREHGMMEMYFACLADPDAYRPGRGFNVCHETYLIALSESLLNVKAFCERVGDDPRPVLNDLLSVYREEFRQRLLQILFAE